MEVYLHNVKYCSDGVQQHENLFQGVQAVFSKFELLVGMGYFMLVWILYRLHVWLQIYSDWVKIDY